MHAAMHLKSRPANREELHIRVMWLLRNTALLYANATILLSFTKPKLPEQIECLLNAISVAVWAVYQFCRISMQSDLSKPPVSLFIRHHFLLTIGMVIRCYRFRKLPHRLASV
jgi:hypothetical protein